jgi:hypothetical protein
MERLAQVRTGLKPDEEHAAIFVYSVSVHSIPPFVEFRGGQVVANGNDRDKTITIGIRPTTV